MRRFTSRHAAPADAGQARPDASPALLVPAASASPSAVAPEPTGVSARRPADERLLRMRDVVALVGMGKSEVYKRVTLGTFPAPVVVAPHVSRWVASEVQQWIAERVASCPRLGARRVS